MKALKVILIIGVVLGLLVAAGLFFLTRFVERPEFRQQLVGLASKATGTTVQLDEMKVSIFRGIELRGVAIGNPSGFAGNFVTAQAFVLRYRLWPLLRKRVEVETLLLDAPVIVLTKNAKGEWNYEKLGGQTEKVQASGTPSETTGGLDVSLQKIVMKNAQMVMVKEDGKELLKVDDANFTSSIDMIGGKLSGSGQAELALATCAKSLFIRDVAAPVAISTEAVRLAPLTGKLAGGTVSGEAQLSLAGDSQYTVELKVKDAEMVTLLQEAGTMAMFTSGKLQMHSKLAGTGGLETIVGTGDAEIIGGQLVNIPLLNLLATLVQVAALQDLKFDEFKLEYTISNNVMQTPVINIKSPQVQITGRGAVALADYTLDHVLTLTLASGALDRAPKEIRQAFTKNADGSYAIEFTVTGPYDSPKTDLQKRLLQGVGEQLLEKGLKKLLK